MLIGCTFHIESTNDDYTLPSIDIPKYPSTRKTRGMQSRVDELEQLNQAMRDRDQLMTHS